MKLSPDDILRNALNENNINPDDIDVGSYLGGDRWVVDHDQSFSTSSHYERHYKRANEIINHKSLEKRLRDDDKELKDLWVEYQTLLILKYGEKFNK